MFGRTVIAWAKAINREDDRKQKEYSSNYATKEAYERKLERNRKKYAERKKKGE